MGTEIIFIVLGLLLVGGLLITFKHSSFVIKDKAKKEKQKQAIEEQKLKSEKSKIVQNTSIGVEDYIKNVFISENKKPQVDVEFEETDEDIKLEEQSNNSYNTGAIRLGQKSTQVFMLDEEDDFNEAPENVNTMMYEIDNDQSDDISPGSEVEIDDFEEDESVGEEFRGMSQKMKILMVENIFNKKSEE